MALSFHQNSTKYTLKISSAKPSFVFPADSFSMFLVAFLGHSFKRYFILHLSVSGKLNGPVVLNSKFENNC